MLVDQSFKEIVAKCLVKDPTKRPTAEELLKHSFFKNAKPLELYVKSLLSDLPPLWDRVKTLKLKDAAQLALKKISSSNQEVLLQSEYQRGVSAWNFDIEDLKAQASLIACGSSQIARLHSTCTRDPSMHDIAWTGGDSQLPNEIARRGARNSPYSNSLSAPIRFLGCGNSSEDNGTGNVIQRKGRFSVTSENVDLLQEKTAATEREHLHVAILQLQARTVTLANELAAERLKYTQLQQKFK
ncbi:hypothetical protein HPP92_007156 [Vanilla planifolia]|uniref:Protein kinase domain-containing protein n=1 Tax=Vanilla planifolia TaxID=51239 RepID=A0A835RQB7_VANPL|nr:hypothetical protein HPP92_007156 [Vanilla planifolia]